MTTHHTHTTPRPGTRAAVRAAEAALDAAYAGAAHGAALAAETDAAERLMSAWEAWTDRLSADNARRHPTD